MNSITQQQECDPVPSSFFNRLVERFSGKRDVLIPYFSFQRVLKGNMESYVLKEIYKLRYEVYCLERHYLEASDFQDDQETDEYDDCSIHFAAYTLNKDIVGTVRLVQPHDGQLYPFETHCSAFPEFSYPPREAAAEISRLVVKKTHRRRRGDSMEGISQDFMEKGSTKTIQPRSTVRRDKRGNSPLLLLGMYREMYRYSRQNGIRYWYAAMERSLARSLEKMGFRFVPIGPQVDYYGPVTPHVADLDELLGRLKRENKFLAAWFNDEPIPLWIMVKTVVGNYLEGRFRKK
jgi:N-acyl amino acid synthase of PEP-CTERM/exosortase system